MGFIDKILESKIPSSLNYPKEFKQILIRKRMEFHFKKNKYTRYTRTFNVRE